LAATVAKRWQPSPSVDGNRRQALTATVAKRCGKSPSVAASRHALATIAKRWQPEVQSVCGCSERQNATKEDTKWSMNYEKVERFEYVSI
jgi:hypothetical protein